jgi:hypothetical protein
MERMQDTAPTEAAGSSMAARKPNRKSWVKRRLQAMQGPRTTATAWAAIQGIGAAHMIRKGQVLGITRHNVHGQAWVFGALLDLR